MGQDTKDDSPEVDPRIERIVDRTVRKNIDQMTPVVQDVDTHLPDHVVRMMISLAAFGKTASAISKETGLPRRAVNAVVESPGGRMEIARLQSRLLEKDMKKFFMQIAPVAVNTAYDLMTSKKTKDHVKLAASEMFMDRAFGKPKQIIEETNINLAEVLSKLEGKKKDASENEPIDAEFERMAADNFAAMTRASERTQHDEEIRKSGRNAEDAAGDEETEGDWIDEI